MDGGENRNDIRNDNHHEINFPYNYNIQSDLKMQHQELNKIEAYTATKRDPQELLAHTKKKFGVNFNIYYC